MLNIYLVRSGNSIPRTIDLERFLSEKAKDDLIFLGKNFDLEKHPIPKHVFCSKAVRAIESAKCLWPSITITEIEELYTPIETNIFQSVKNYLRKNKIHEMKNIWMGVGQKSPTEEAVTSVYETCHKSAEKITRDGVVSETIAIVAHDIIVNLVGYFLTGKIEVLNTRLNNGEAFFYSSVKDEIEIWLP